MADKNDDYDAIFTYLHRHEYPTGFDKSQKRALRRKACNSYKAENGTLYYSARSNASGPCEWKQVPRSVEDRNRILEACHALPEGGHLGRDKTYHKIAERFYWKLLWKDVKEYVRTCEVCQRTNDAKFVKEAAPLHPIPVKPKVWRQVGIDLVGPLPETKSGNRYIITLVDYFSKWPEAAALPDKTAEGVALFLYRTICRYGCTKITISDQGREFVNKLSESLFERTKTEHRISTAYHPQTNGLVERYNQTLQRSLLKLVNKQQDNWDEFIDGVLFAYRTSKQKSTQFTPFELMYCRKPVLPIEHEMLDCDSLESLSDEEEDEGDVNQYGEEMLKFRKTLFSKANTNIKSAQDRQKRDYDRKHHRQMEWKPGALVWLRNSARDSRKKKFLARWLGPYKIIKCLDKNVYKIARLSTGNVLKKAVNGCRLKPYHRRSEKQSSYTPPRLFDSFVFQHGTPSSSEASKSSHSGLGDDDTIQPLPPPMPPLSELKGKPRAPIISESDEEDLDGTVPPLPPPMPPLSELKGKPRAPIISASDKDDLDGTVPPLLPPMPPLSDGTISPLLNGFEGFTPSTPILEGGFFPEFLPQTALNLPSPIPTMPPSTQPTSAKPPSTQPTSANLPTQPKLTNKPSRKRKRNGAKELMFHRRQKRVRENSYQDAITVEDYKLKEPAQPQKLWIPELNLAKSDQDILLNPTAWLTDSLMDAAQMLLKKANPAMSGLQSVMFGTTMNFDVEPGEFVQILHNGHGHWLTISTVGNEHPQVEVYDSVFSCCPTMCKAQIAALLATKQPTIELKFMDVQMQSGGYDCGLFAIAFATAIVFGKQPGLFYFDQSKMRGHFRKCLEQGYITMFPLKRMRRRTKVKTTEPIRVYCNCRMPELTQTKWIECSSCKEWYHADTCIQVDPKYFNPKCSWFCPLCKKV